MLIITRWGCKGVKGCWWSSVHWRVLHRQWEDQKRWSKDLIWFDWNGKIRVSFKEVSSVQCRRNIWLKGNRLCSKWTVSSRGKYAAFEKVHRKGGEVTREDGFRWRNKFGCFLIFFFGSKDLWGWNIYSPYGSETSIYPSFLKTTSTFSTSFYLKLSYLSCLLSFISKLMYSISHSCLVAIPTKSVELCVCLPLVYTSGVLIKLKWRMQIYFTKSNQIQKLGQRAHWA